MRDAAADMAARRPPVPGSDEPRDTPEDGPPRRRWTRSRACGDSRRASGFARPTSGCSPTSTTSAAARPARARRPQRKGRRAALLPLLPVLDTLERALATGSTDPRLLRGRGRDPPPVRARACARPAPSPSTASASRSIRSSTRRVATVDRTRRSPARWCARCSGAGGWATSCCAPPGRGRGSRGDGRPVAVKFRDYYEVLGCRARRPPTRSSGCTASSRASTIPISSRPPSGPRPRSGSRRSTRPTRS